MTIAGGAWCPCCQTQKLVVKNKISHGFHLVMTIFTLGLWSFVWVAVAIFNAGRFRCSTCGSRI